MTSGEDDMDGMSPENNGEYTHAPKSGWALETGPVPDPCSTLYNLRSKKRKRRAQQQPKNPSMSPPLNGDQHFPKKLELEGRPSLEPAQEENIIQLVQTKSNKR